MMEMLVRFVLYIWAFALMVVVGTFFFMAIGTVLDTIDERRQARERNKRGRVKWKS